MNNEEEGPFEGQDTDYEEDNVNRQNNFSLREGYNKLTEAERAILMHEAHEDDSNQTVGYSRTKPSSSIFTLRNIKKRAVDCISKSVLHEDKNIEKLLDAGMSAFTGEPINLIVEGPPSEGKTFMIVNTLKVFPEEYLEIYRDASPKSFTREKGQLALRIIEDEEKKFVTTTENLFTHERQTIGEYKEWLENEIDNEDSGYDEGKLSSQLYWLRKNLVTLIDLEHRIVVFLDRPQPELWRSLLSVLSHDTYFTETLFVEGTGTLYTKHVVYKGWPAFIFATTKDEVLNFHDLESRFEVTEPVMSPEKYTDATAAKINKLYGIEKIDNSELKALRKDVKSLIQYLLEGNRKVSPITPMKPDQVFRILFNAETQKIQSGDLMRKIPRLLLHVGLNCLWHLNQRVILKNGEDEKVLIAADDLRSISKTYGELEVNALLAGFPVSNYEFLTKVLMPQFVSLQGDEERKVDRVLQKDIRKALGNYTMTKKQTYLKGDKMAFSRYLKFLGPEPEGRGFIEVEKDEKDKRANWIRLIVEENDLLTSIDKRIEEIGTQCKILAHEHIGVLLNADYTALYKSQKIGTKSHEGYSTKEKTESTDVPEMTENAIRPIDVILACSGYTSILPDVFVPNFVENGKVLTDKENSASLSNSEMEKTQKTPSIRDVPINFEVSSTDKVKPFYYVGGKEKYHVQVMGLLGNIVSQYQIELSPEDIATIPESMGQSLQELGLGKILNGGIK